MLVSDAGFVIYIWHMYSVCFLGQCKFNASACYVRTISKIPLWFINHVIKPYQHLLFVYTCYGNNNANWLATILRCFVWECHSNRNMDVPQVCLCLITPHSSLYNNNLTGIGTIALARVLQHKKSLEELKWVGTECLAIRKWGSNNMYHWLW